MSPAFRKLKTILSLNAATRDWRRNCLGALDSGFLSIFGTHALITKVMKITHCIKLIPASCSGKSRIISRLESHSMFLALPCRWDSAGSDAAENVRRLTYRNSSLRSLRYPVDVQKIDKRLVWQVILLSC